MPSLKLNWETWEDFWPEGQKMTQREYDEHSGWLDAKRPFKLDDKILEQENSRGVFNIATARVNGKLAGYCFWTLQTDIESEGLLIAIQGALYVLPEALPCGVKLFKWCLGELKASGIKFVYLHHPVYGRGVGLEKLFSRLGGRKTNVQYLLCLED